MPDSIFSSHTTLDNNVLYRFLDLGEGKAGTKIQAEYVWIGGSGQDLRCKTRTLNQEITHVSQLPDWSFDGSSTGQAPGEDSEVILIPKYFCLDPFRGGKNIMVMCENHKPDNGGPIDGNTRTACQEVHDKIVHEIPWFGIEQEYTLFEADGVTPFGWPRAGFPGPQGPYYCAIGTENSYGRHIVEAHYKACLYAGMDCSGVNGEVMPGQWEYQIGPSIGIDCADQLWMSRYALTRVCELFQIIVSLDPKPIPGDWNGAGCHSNFSTEKMRQPGGYQYIIEALERMKPKHFEHIELYGTGNERRLTGKHETASITQFSYGVANRGCSCRIPRVTEKEGCGYFEDRRPASNMDPYLVCYKIMKTCVLNE